MSTKKKTKELLVEDPVVRSGDWYTALCEEVDSIRVETTYNAMDTLLGGKLAIGKAIEKYEEEAKPTELVKQLALDLKVGERDLWYCYKFSKEYDTIKNTDVFQSKAVSWNKIKKLLADPAKAKEPCLHLHPITVCLCEDCGAKITDES